MTAEDIATATGQPLRSVQALLRQVLGPTPRGHHRTLTRAELARLALALGVSLDALTGYLGLAEAA